MKYSVRVFQTVDAIEELRADWMRLQQHPNSDFEHYRLICTIRKESCSPFVVAICRNNVPVSILVARSESAQIEPAVGYAKPIRLHVKRLVVIYQGLLGEIDDEIAALTLDALDGALRSEQIDVVEFFNLPEGSPLLGVVKRSKSWLFRDGSTTWASHWELTLPREAGGILQKMSAKHRGWIRRKMRDLEAAYPSAVCYRRYSNVDGIDELCCSLEKVASVTYQRSLSAGFINDEEQRSRLALFGKRGELRAWTLHLSNEPKAYALGFLYGGKFHFAMTGYDPELRKYEIGTLIFVHMVNELTAEGVQVLDFGLGDAAYKQRFGDRVWKEGSLRMYRRSPKGLIARMTVGVLGSVDRAGRRIVARVGALNKVKTSWRRRLAPTTGGDDK